jgi:hypothetical protein
LSAVVDRPPTPSLAVVLQEAVVTTDTDALAETVREALRRLPRPESDKNLDGYLHFEDMAALDALATRLEACEEREELNMDNESGIWITVQLGRELERVKAERDALEMELSLPRLVQARAEARLDKALGLVRVLAMGKFATPHPDGAFGLGSNSWEVPGFVQKMATHVLAEIEELS